MRKKISFTLILLALFVGAIAGGYYGIQWYQDEYTPITKVMREHDVATLDTLIAETDDAIIYVGDPSCGDSDAFETWFLAALPTTDWEATQTWEYVSVRSLRLNDTFEAFKSEFAITTTPTLVHVVDGKIVDQIAWSLRDGFEQAVVTDWINAQ